MDSNSGTTERPMFEPSLRCIARHAIHFTIMFIVIGTIGTWITGAEPWGPADIGFMVLMVQIPTIIVSFGPEGLRRWANDLFR
ncbi:MAG: hypothetical protein OXQ28_12995 [Acidobacteriota bacterium]|nr:hypothetical protein [Acidobacteriota bacterium]